MTNKTPTSEQIDALFSALLNDILNMTDEEIVSEAHSDFGDAAEEADRIRRNIRRTILNQKVQNFESLKMVYPNSRFESLPLPTKIDSTQLLCDSPYIEEFKIAAQNLGFNPTCTEQSSLTDSQISQILDKRAK